MIEYKEVIKKPPAALMTQCVMPFDTRPKTYGEAVERDEVWRHSLVLCAKKIKAIRYFHMKNKQVLK